MDTVIDEATFHQLILDHHPGESVDKCMVIVRDTRAPLCIFRFSDFFFRFRRCCADAFVKSQTNNDTYTKNEISVVLLTPAAFQIRKRRER